MRGLFTCSTLIATLVLGTPAHAQPASENPPAAEPDTARLRQALAAAFGADIEIARTELSNGLRERGGTFWLVHARPRRSGDYQLRYRYAYRDHARPDDPLYTHVEHTSYLRVGDAGCRRSEGKDVCLGDILIVPFVVNDYTGHTFHVTRREPYAGTWNRPQIVPGPEIEAIPNPVSAHLRLLETRTDEQPHRACCANTFVHSATFEAIAPGRFNLQLGSRGPGEPQLPVQTSPFGSIPVLIVPRDEPVTVLLRNETVVGTDEKQGFSSHSGNQYLTTLLLLQPGDRITLEYATYTVRNHPASMPRPRQGPAEPLELEPSITAYPFHLDLDHRFNAWIVDHLPAER